MKRYEVICKRADKIVARFAYDERELAMDILDEVYFQYPDCVVEFKDRDPLNLDDREIVFDEY